MNMANGPTTTQIIFSSTARKQLLEGITIAAEAVGCTLGPCGHTVLIQQGEGRPMVTKDGYTVARSINLKDPVQRMGAQLILEAASHTNDIAGDGTTTATVLTHALVKGGMRLVEAGYGSQEVGRGMEAASRHVIDVLKSNAVKLETDKEVASVGTVSANGDHKIGELIAEAMHRVGRDGIITVEDAKGMATSMDIVEGMQMSERGYLSPFFVTNPEKMVAVYNDVFVMVTDKKVSTMSDIVPILEKVMHAQGRLLIIAEDVEGEALQGLIVNRVKGNLPVVAVKAPGYGQHRNELLSDICILTGAKLVSSATGIDFKKVQLSDMGTCKKIVVDAKTTTLVTSGTTKEQVSKHVSDLKSQLTDVTLGPDEVTKLKVRIAKLASGVAIIRVGGSTEVEMIERKHRIEDALNATKAAVEEGIVPGGGQALLRAASHVRGIMQTTNREFDEGYKALLKACEAPLKKIVTNAGGSPEVVVNHLNDPTNVSTGYGYNAATGEYMDLIAAGVIDPLKVTRSALEHAVSVAITFLSLDAVVFDERPAGDGTGA